MTMPNFPNIPELPDIDICESLGLVVESIALEELALAHLINAEAEKIQKVASPEHCASPFEMVKINESVSKALVNVIKLQMLLQFKLENVLDKLPDVCDDDPCPPHHKKKKCD